MKYGILLAFAFISACANTSSTSKNDPSLATLRGNASDFSAAFNPLSPIYGASFSSVDGNDITSFGGAFTKKEIQVNPGMHTVMAHCSWTRGGLKLKSKKEFTEIFEAGKTYIFKASLGEGAVCELEMSENPA